MNHMNRWATPHMCNTKFVEGVRVQEAHVGNYERCIPKTIYDLRIDAAWSLFLIRSFYSQPLELTVSFKDWSNDSL